MRSFSIIIKQTEPSSDIIYFIRNWEQHVEQGLTSISGGRNDHWNFYQCLKINYCQHQPGSLTTVAGLMGLLTLNHVCAEAI